MNSSSNRAATACSVCPGTETRSSLLMYVPSPSLRLFVLQLKLVTQMNRYFRLDSADLVVPNQEAWRLLWDFTTLKELADALPGNSILQNKALTAANEIMNVFKRGNPAGVRAARRVAEGIFGCGWEGKGADIYNEGPKRALIWGIGMHSLLFLVVLLTPLNRAVSA